LSPAQALSFAVVGGAILVFVWGGFRYDLVTLTALLIGIASWRRARRTRKAGHPWPSVSTLDEQPIEAYRAIMKLQRS
jgi:hypothetical protein